MSKELENRSFEELLQMVKELDSSNAELKSSNLEFEYSNSELESSNSELESSNLELESSNSYLESSKSKLENKVVNLESTISFLQYQVNQLKRLQFGAKRERFTPEDKNQFKLPFDVEQDTNPELDQETITYVRKKKKRKNHPGRMKLPSHLPVEEIILEPDCDTTGMKCIGREITEQLEIVPAKFFIKRYIRPKYITVENNDTLTQKGIIADLPVFPIEKGMAGASVLSQILVDKFIDHLPIYRQLQRFKREDIELSASTINGWQSSVCELLEPLYQNMKNRVLQQGYLQVDETPIKVLDKNKKGKTHQGYYWIYHCPIEKMVFFDYQKGRSREGPKKLLKNFKGYLQTDGYNVYDYIVKQNSDIVHLNCMAHARRYFEQALDYDENATYAMHMFQQIYAIERQAKEQKLDPKERYELRLKKSLPLLNDLGKWIFKMNKIALPKSPLGKALNYCMQRWDNLMNYLRDGYLEIDSNLAENAIRPIAIGRKNYLFAGSHHGAERAAMMYSFFANCKKHNVNPFDWLSYVLVKIPQHKVNKLHELLPQNFKPQ